RVLMAVAEARTAPALAFFQTLGGAGGLQLSAGDIAALGLLATLDEVTETEISNDSISSPKIQAGAIGAGHIAANSITASKLLITDTSNIFPDPLLADVQENANGWSTVGAVDLLISTGGADVSGGFNTISVVGGQSGTGGWLSPPFPVERSQWYHVGGFAGAVNSGGQTTNCESAIVVRWYSDANASTQTGSDVVAGTSTATFGGLSAPNISAKLQAPSDAIRARLYFRRTGNSLTDRKSTRLNSSHVKISYAVFCLKKK